MSKYRCNYYFSLTVPATGTPDEQVVNFNNEIFSGQLEYVIEETNGEIRIFPTTIASAAILITFEIIHVLIGNKTTDEIPEYPQPYTPMNTHYFIPNGYGVIRLATASGEPRFEPSEKFNSLLPGRVKS